MQTFIIDVQFSTHDALKDGIVSLGFRRFQIQDNDADHASLIAAQWVASSGSMPTATAVHV